MDRTKVKAAVFDGFIRVSKSQEFWGNPKFWPRETADYLFLADAVHEIGEAYFGNEWSFDEPVTATPRPLRQDDSARAREILRNLAADFVADEAITPEHLKKADEFIAQRRKETLPKTERFWHVQDIIATACADGKLVSKTRAAQGGLVSNLAAHMWNTEQLEPRFRFCQIDPDDPFQEYADLYGSPSEPRGGDHRLIFITRKSFQPFLEELKASRHDHRPQDIPGVHLSRYMRVMLEVIKDEGISAENQPKKTVLAELFSQKWQRRYGESLSQNLADSMATLVREPESQQGRAAKKPKVE